MRISKSVAAVTALAFLLASCGGGGSSTTPVVTPPPPPPPPSTVFPVPAQESLSTADVEKIMAQAITEAKGRNLPSIIAVTDRVGNVLGVFKMTGAKDTAMTPPAPSGKRLDLQGATIPAVSGAIAKAITGAYLSSGGNAFSSRTASQIVQQHFPPSPTTLGLESGPLYGVQFSQLPCSDLSARFPANAMLGPKRSPLGLSADAGGFPLYKNGVLVGGIGVMGDGVYGLDTNILDVEDDAEEHIALAATVGFDAPAGIRADRITVDGTLLRYSDAVPANFKGGAAPAFSTLNGTAGSLVAVRGYNDAVIIAGSAYGSEASGIRASTAAEFSNRDAFILTNGAGVNRFPVKAATDGAAVAQPLSAADVRAILEEAFLIMSRARAQIRQPLDSRAQVSISVVDTNGAALGVVRSPDAPIFGTDVSLQKARTAMFFSHPQAAAQLLANPNGDVGRMLIQARAFFNDQQAFTGKFAFSNRAIGNIARPYFPDGELGRLPGPFSPGIDDFNPFATGLQSALIAQDVVQNAFFVLGISNLDVPQQCTRTPDAVPGQNRIQNGIQIFPGSVPIYRGNTLVGAIGISGDGIDQDDMIAFLGANNGTAKAGGGLSNAPSAIRSDQIVVALADGKNVRLRWVGCPFAPFVDTSDSNVCQGR